MSSIQVQLYIEYSILSSQKTTTTKIIAYISSNQHPWFISSYPIFLLTSQMSTLSQYIVLKCLQNGSIGLQRDQNP